MPRPINDIIREYVRNAVDPVKRSVRLSIKRAVIQLVDEKDLQSLQIKVLSGMVRDDVERIQEYGFTSHPHSGAEAVVLFPGGDTSNGLVIATDDRRYRLKLEQGEVSLYDDMQQQITLKRDGILLKSPMKVTVDTPQSLFTGHVNIAGNLSVMGSSVLQGAVTAITSVTTPIVTATTSMAAPLITAATSLIVAGKQMLTHKHTDGTDAQGNTGGPI